MSFFAKILPLALAAAGALCLATTAQAKTADAGLKDFGHALVFQGPTPAPALAANEQAVDSVSQLFPDANQEFLKKAVLGYNGSDEISPLPATGAWAMMLAGFGLAGAALRRGQLYRLVEEAANGTIQSEEFHAPDDQSALARALSVAEGVRLELWRGDELIRQVDAPIRAAS